MDGNLTVGGSDSRAGILGDGVELEREVDDREDGFSVEDISDFLLALEEGKIDELLGGFMFDVE